MSDRPEIERRRERSLAAIRQWFPRVAGRLSQAVPLERVLIADTVIDLATGDGRLYGGNAWRRSREQVDAFLGRTRLRSWCL
jgi:hypothetical protein